MLSERWNRSRTRMKIVQIIPGSGNRFYCQNCFRDEVLVRSLRAVGHDVIAVPLYLPLFGSADGSAGDTPVFYGAISVFLEQLFPAFGRLPGWVRRVFDLRPFLTWAANFAGSTRPDGLAGLTASMLRGETGRQAVELDALVRWLDREGSPDIIHLSNALLLGLARVLKERLGAPVICSLQDEWSWIEAMSVEDRERIWALVSERSRDADALVSVSRWYAERVSSKLGISSAAIRVVQPGVDVPAEIHSAVCQVPTVGYLSRLSFGLGMDILAKAYILLRKQYGISPLRLWLAGGATRDDRADIATVREWMHQEGLGEDVVIEGGFGGECRDAFFRRLTVLSVPAPDGEAFGMYIPEAWSHTVPVVQPRLGAFPELVEAHGGGVLYEPNTPERLAAVLAELLGDRSRLARLARAGRQAAEGHFSAARAAGRMLAVYEEVSGRG